MRMRLHSNQDRPRGSKRRIFLRAVGLFAPFRWHFAALLVLIGATATLNLAPALLIARIVTEVTPAPGGTIREQSLQQAPEVVVDAESLTAEEAVAADAGSGGGAGS